MNLIAISFTILLLPGGFFGYAQQDEKFSANLYLSYTQKNESLPVITVSVKTKKGRKFEPVEGAVINIFFMEESAEGFMGRVKTNSLGLASLPLPEQKRTAWMSLPTVTFLATLTGSDKFEDASEEIEIQKARIELNLTEEDSVRTITAKVKALEDSAWIEVPDVDVKLMVMTTLAGLPVGEDEVYTTDESGEVSAEFTLEIPGDAQGMIQIGAKIEDHELYGNIMTTQPIAWGIPTNYRSTFNERTLYATRDKTPLWLLIFPNLIIAGVWGMILYLVSVIRKIRKLGIS
ncbi:MAG: hypothetical protein ACK4RF_12045 [Cyclobacteriaceae bacterium]